jgi:1-acyl-sn-glycerol-3-phosphate acyltransferase
MVGTLYSIVSVFRSSPRAGEPALIAHPIHYHAMRAGPTPADHPRSVGGNPGEEPVVLCCETVTPPHPSPRLPTRTLAWTARTLNGPAATRHLADVRLEETGHGFDAFGARREWVALGAGALRGLYERYFRVISDGAANIPKRGGAVLAANHSGTLPFDAAMLWLDVLRHTAPPRLLRPVADHFVQRMPFIGTFSARIGTIAGSRGNVQFALAQGELLLVFPEGTPGIKKPFWKRYQLQTWRVGHVEMAIRHRVPVLPVAIVGAEEQMPQVGQLPIRLFGAPFLPLPLTPIPLPVRYRILYGSPIPMHERYGPEDADDPTILGRASQEVRDAVAALIKRGLDERKGVFR